MCIRTKKEALPIRYIRRMKRLIVPITRVGLFSYDIDGFQRYKIVNAITIL